MPCGRGCSRGRGPRRYRCRCALYGECRRYRFRRGSRAHLRSRRHIRLRNGNARPAILFPYDISLDILFAQTPLIACTRYLIQLLLQYPGFARQLENHRRIPALIFRLGGLRLRQFPRRGRSIGRNIIRRSDLGAFRRTGRRFRNLIVSTHIHHGHYRTYRNGIALLKQYLHYLTLHRRRNLRTDFGCIHFKQHIIFLDDVPHLYRPGDNSPFGYTFAQLGHLYLKSRHIVKF